MVNPIDTTIRKAAVITCLLKNDMNSCPALHIPHSWWSGKLLYRWSLVHWLKYPLSFPTACVWASNQELYKVLKPSLLSSGFTQTNKSSFRKFASQTPPTRSTLSVSKKAYFYTVPVYPVQYLIFPQCSRLWHYVKIII